MQSTVEVINANAIAAYRAGKHEDAVSFLNEALALAGKSARAALLKNRGVTQAALQRWELAEADYTQALACATESRLVQQCLLKRSFARSCLEKHKLALSDAEAAAQVVGIERFRALEQARLCRSALEADKAALQREVMIGRCLVHAGQTLRLIFASVPPKQLRVGERITLYIRIVNEFGLWRVHDWPSVTGDTTVRLCAAGAGLLITEPIKMGEEGKATVEVVAGAHPQPGVVLRVDAQDSTKWLRLPMAVLSLPFDIVADKASNSAAPTDDNVGAVCCREVGSVIVAEAPGALGIGGKLWDASFAILAHLEASEDIRDQVVLELGSGVGLVGIAARKSLGAGKVFVTDSAEILPLLCLNIRLNGVQDTVHALELDWTKESTGHSLNSIPSVLLLSDVVYDPYLHQPLLNTLQRLLSTFQPQLVLLAHRHRNPQDTDFFYDLHRRFIVKSVPLPDEPSVPNDIELFRIWSQNS